MRGDAAAHPLGKDRSSSGCRARVYELNKEKMKRSCLIGTEV